MIWHQLLSPPRFRPIACYLSGYDPAIVETSVTSQPINPSDAAARAAKLSRAPAFPDASEVASGKVGVLIVALGPPDGYRLLVDAALPEGVPVRPARHRDAALAVVADPQSHHPDHPAREERKRLRFDLEQGAGRGTAQDNHTVAK